jgi:hypothetical protein
LLAALAAAIVIDAPQQNAEALGRTPYCHDDPTIDERYSCMASP